MQSKAATVAEYIASLPPDRREAVEAVRAVILKNLDKGYGEGMSYGMMGYFVPHSIYPAGYHCDPKQPLPFAGIASQKQGISVYLMGLYIGGDEGSGEETAESRWFRDAWAKTGKKLDMGKSCVRFKKLEDVALDVLGEAIRRVPAKLYIERYLQNLETRGTRGTRGKTENRPAAPKKAAAKKTAPIASPKPAGKAAKKAAKKSSKESSSTPGRKDLA